MNLSVDLFSFKFKSVRTVQITKYNVVQYEFKTLKNNERVLMLRLFVVLADRKT